MKSLAAAMQYENADVTMKFRNRFAVTPEDADDIFAETKRWLWFAVATTLDTVAINRAMLMIDEMWHTFITFTTEYTEYCESNFGRYVHHAPTPAAEMEDAVHLLERDPDAYRVERGSRMRAQFQEIRRLLGEETLKKWQVTYRDKYPPDACAALAIEAISRRPPEDPRGVVASNGQSLAAIGSQKGEALIDALVDLEVDSPNHIPRCDIGYCGGFQCVCNQPPK